MKLALAWERETAALRALPIDTELAAAAVERVLDAQAQLPDRDEAALLALLLRGHLALLVLEMTEALDHVKQDESVRVRGRRSLAEAEHLLASPPIYTARGTAAVVPLAYCCRDLHRHLAGAAPTHCTP
ncbi:DUF6415 family natural product biosynthesis protein [Streptomyces sp. NPDC057280]|uniref:DUF6415 family natural product biosynthesis protein n=1 Tax=Streptomyces sp. NPDC057280 TaxID=3346081 RepID=UPI00363947BE